MRPALRAAPGEARVPDGIAGHRDYHVLAIAMETA